MISSDSSDEEDEQLAMTETLPLPGTKCAGAESSSELIDCIDIDDDDDDDEGEGGDTSIVDPTGQEDSQEVFGGLLGTEMHVRHGCLRFSELDPQ